MQWLWVDRIPYAYPTLLTGEGQLGKSTLCSEIVASVTKGHRLPENPWLNTSDVVWLAAEEHPASVIRPRLEAANADLSRVHFPGWNPDGSVGRRIRLPSQAPLLRDFMLKVKAHLLVIDPIGSFLDTEAFEDSAGTARNVMQCLGDVANATNGAVIIVKHPRKGGQGAAIDQISGSKEWVNVARSVLVVAQHPHFCEWRLLASVKSNLGARPTSLQFVLRVAGGSTRVEWLGGCKMSADDVFGPNLDSVDKDTLAEAKAMLKDRLDAGPKPAKEMLRAAEDCGISARSLRRAKKELGIHSVPVGPNENRYHEWRKPPEGWVI